MRIQVKRLHGYSENNITHWEKFYIYIYSFIIDVIIYTYLLNYIFGRKMSVFPQGKVPVFFLVIVLQKGQYKFPFYSHCSICLIH